MPQSGANLDGNVDDFGPMKHVPVLLFFVQAATIDQCHGKKQTAFVLAVTEQSHDIAMIQGQQGIDLTPQGGVLQDNDVALL